MIFRLIWVLSEVLRPFKLLGLPQGDYGIFAFLLHFLLFLLHFFGTRFFAKCLLKKEKVLRKKEKCLYRLTTLTEVYFIRVELHSLL